MRSNIMILNFYIIHIKYIISTKILNMWIVLEDFTCIGILFHILGPDTLTDKKFSCNIYTWSYINLDAVFHMRYRTWNSGIIGHTQTVL